MRKIIPLMLAVALLLSMNVHSVVRATDDNVVGSTGVKANVISGAKDVQVISVDIVWEGMEFTFNEASERVWDAENHVYIPGTAASWAESDAYITITNHSNVILQANIASTMNAAYDDMSLTFTDVMPFIGSADTGDGENAGVPCSVTVRTIPMGTLKTNPPAGENVGSIVVSVQPVEQHMAAWSAVSALYADVALKTDGNLPRGTLYFESETVSQQIASAIGTTKTVLEKTTATVPEKNAALNALLTAYYNNQYLMQE